jgi:hypothetical protein
VYTRPENCQVTNLFCFSFLLRDIILQLFIDFAERRNGGRPTAAIVGKEPGAGFDKGMDMIELVEAYGNVKLAHAGHGVDHPIDVSGEGPGKAGRKVATGHD